MSWVGYGQEYVDRRKVVVEGGNVIDYVKRGNCPGWRNVRGSISGRGYPRGMSNTHLQTRLVHP